jgi:hypothetical protein
VATNFDDLYQQAHKPSEAAAPAAQGSSGFEDLYKQAHQEADAPAATSSSPEWGDAYKAGKAALYDTAADLMTGAQRFADTVGTQSASEANRRSAVDMANEAEAIRQTMTEGGKRISDAQILPGQDQPGVVGSMMEHPGYTLAIKGGQLAGSVIPYAGAAMIGGIPADIGLGAAGQAGGSMRAAIGASNAMTDDELKAASPRFAQLLQEQDQNLSLEQQGYNARIKFRDELYTTPQLAADLATGAAFGWATNRTMGAGAKAITGHTVEKVGEQGVGAAEHSALRSMTEQSVAGSVGGVTADYAQQRSEAASKDATGIVGQSAAFDADIGRLARAGINAGFENMVAAGAPHGVGHLRGKASAYLNEQVPVPQKVEHVSEAGGDAAQNAALATTTNSSPAAPLAPTAPTAPAAAPVPKGWENRPSGPVNGGPPDPVTPAANTAPVEAAPAPQVPPAAPITEPPAQLAAQATEVAEGRKAGVVYPAGTENIPPQPLEGLRRYVSQDGTTIDYDPQNFLNQSGTPSAERKIGKKLERMLKDGSLSEENGYGRYSQEQVAQHVAETGEQPAVLQSQTAEGQPINDVATAPSLKAEQAADMAQTLPPDGKIIEKPVEQVLTERREPPPVSTEPARAVLNPETGRVKVGEWEFSVGSRDAIAVKKPGGDWVNYYDREERPHYGRQGEAYLDEAGAHGIPDVVQEKLRDYLKQKQTPEQFTEGLNAPIKRDAPVTPTAKAEPVTPAAKPTRPKKAQAAIDAGQKRAEVAPVDAQAAIAERLAERRSRLAGPDLTADPTKRAPAPEIEAEVDTRKAGKRSSHENNAIAARNDAAVKAVQTHLPSVDVVRKAAGVAVDSGTAKSGGTRQSPETIKARQEMKKAAAKIIAAFHEHAKAYNDKLDKGRMAGLSAATQKKHQVSMPGAYATNISDGAKPPSAVALLLAAKKILGKNPSNQLWAQFARHYEFAMADGLDKFSDNVYRDRRAEGDVYGGEKKAAAQEKAAIAGGHEAGTDLTDTLADTRADTEDEILSAIDAERGKTADVEETKSSAEVPLSYPEANNEVGITKDEHERVKEAAAKRAEEVAAEEAEKAKGRTVAESEKDRIAREALARAAQKETGVKAPEPPKPAPKPVEKTDTQKMADEWLAKHADALKEIEPEDVDYMTAAMKKAGYSEDDVFDAMEKHIDAGDKFVIVGSGAQKKSVAIRETKTAKEAVPRSALMNSELMPEEKLYMPLVHKRMMELAGDVQVHYLEDTPYNRANVADKRTGTAADGFYDPRTNAVYVIKGKNEEVNLHVLMHEIGHAATSKAINASDELRGEIDSLIQHLKDEHGDVWGGSRPGGSVTQLGDAYGLKNAKEFVAEFQGNSDFRQVLKTIVLPSELAKKLGLPGWSKGTVYDAVVNLIRKALGLPPKSISALEAAMALTDRAHTIQERVRNGETVAAIDYMTGSKAPGTMRRVDQWKQDAGKFASKAAKYVGIDGLLDHTSDRMRGAITKVAFTHNILRGIDETLGTDLGLRLHQLVEGRHSLENNLRDYFGGQARTREAEQLKKTHGKDFDALVDITDNARLAGVDLDAGPEQFKGDSFKKAAAEEWYNAHKEEIDRLKSVEDLWGGMKQIRDTFDAMHTEAGISRIASIWTNNLVAEKGLGIANDPLSQKSVRGLAERFFNNALTKADERKLGLDSPDLVQNGGDKAYPSEAVRLMTEARAQFAKENNTYRPFHREGTHWAVAKRTIQHLGDGGELLNDRAVQFVRREGETKKGFEDRVKKYIGEMQVKHGFDMRDAERVTLDPKDLKGAPIEKESADGVDGVRMIFATEYADKTFGGTAAEQRVNAMTADDSRDKPIKTKNNEYVVDGKTYTFFDKEQSGAYEASARRFDSTGARALSPRLTALAKRLEAQVDFSNLNPAQQEATRQALMDAALLGRTGSSALGTHTISDRKVRGFTKDDFSRVVADYVDQAARDIAGSRLQPRIDATRDKLSKMVTGYRKTLKTGTDEEKRHKARVLSEQHEEVMRRYDDAKQDTSNRLIRDILHATSLDKLANFAFNAVNAMEAPIMGGTMIAGRHGYGATYREMAKLGREIGSWDVVKKAGKQTLAARDIMADHVDYGKMIAAKGGDIKTVMDHFEKTGLVSPEAEYFFSQESRARGNKVEKWLATADRMGRQMTMGVETINRALTGVTAYRLEKARLEKAHEGEMTAAAKRKIETEALDYAYNTTIDTMGNYSRTNSGSLFNSTALGAAMQFRKYGVKTYTMLGRMVKDLPKNGEARRSFAGLMAIQAMTAGVAGLPLEPFRLAANVAGINDDEWEEGLRTMFAGASPDVREALVHGVGRLFNVDLGAKLGMGGLSGIKLPKSVTNQQDLAQWLGELLGGASLSTVAESAKALGKVFAADSTAGDRISGLAEAVPIKIVSDTAKAVSGKLNDPETKRGLTKSEKYSVPEMLIKASGFTPGREASERERRGTNFQNQREQQTSESHIKQRWVKAKSGAERTAVLEEMREFNKTAGRDARLSASDLIKYQRTHSRLNKDAVLGQTVKKNERDIFKKSEKLFGAY